MGQMTDNFTSSVGLVLCIAALALGYLRWLRVAQREHYLPGAAVRFARRWWTSSLANRVAGVIGAAGALGSLWYPPAGFAAAVVAGAGPLGLRLRGSTSKLAWTGRLRRLALIGALVACVAIGVPGIVGLHEAFSAAAISAMAAPVLVDLAMWLARPLEARLLRRYVQVALQRLRAVAPRVVAITGSFGKTTTKGYVAHLLAGSLAVVATPASFNNTAGLARAINEHLPAGTQVFVAEMGTYGPGEIASMCEWATPEVAVITAIGPVHLERMRSVERIAASKAEIVRDARVVVLNVDYPMLEQVAARAEQDGKAVWRCASRSSRADVVVKLDDGNLKVKVAHRAVQMDLVVAAAPEVDPGNVACAVAVALSLGAPASVVAARLASLPGPPHRRSPQRGANGAEIIDDTYNSNPAGAEAALALLGRLGANDGKKFVVTPGMVELGAAQERENTRFAAMAAAVATEVVVVGRTNASALVAGARAAGAPVHRCANRAAAVEWVSGQLGPGDVVLYENDLPDHYP